MLNLKIWISINICDMLNICAYKPALRQCFSVVNQNPANIAQFGNQAIHNTNNIVNLPHGKGTIHNKITKHYLSKAPYSDNKRVRDWLKTKSFQFQYDYGMDKLKEFGWYQ